MRELTFLVEETSDGGYTARALGESIFTEAETLDELRLNVKDAVACHLEPGSALPVVRLHIDDQEALAPRSCPATHQQT